MRNLYNLQLAELNSKLLQMCALIEDAINGAVESISRKDGDKARTVIEADKFIDRQEKEIEQLCLKLILTEQPVAQDLRTISSALKMITDMERIGDHAEDICEIVLKSGKCDISLDYGHISEMAKATVGMVKDSIVAFTRRDIALSESVCLYDDVVDSLFAEARKDVVELIRHDIKLSDRALDLFMIAKYFERIGDHATNIAEWVIFAITGVHKTVR